MDKALHDRLKKALKDEIFWEAIYYEGGETLHYLITSNRFRTVYFLYEVDMTIAPHVKDNNTIRLLAKAKTPDILHRRIEPL